MILKVDFVLKLSSFTSLKRFICLKWIIKNFSTILNSQFNYHTLPVTPFNINWRFWCVSKSILKKWIWISLWTVKISSRFTDIFNSLIIFMLSQVDSWDLCFESKKICIAGFGPEAEFKEFEPRLKYGRFHLKLYYPF